LLQKVISLNEIYEVIEEEKKSGKKIVQCHGVFDLLHPGHIRHFQEAKKQGNLLIVSITPDKYVNKGPGRPIFNEQLRLECLASLDLVDYVVLNDSSDAVSCISKVRPDVYVKGKEYAKHEKDVTGKISDETREVEKFNGKVYYTNDIVFSSSTLINKFFDPLPIGLQQVIKKIKEKYSCDEIIQKIEDFSKLKVLVIGDAIIDEYQYVEPLGQSGKGLHMVAKNIDCEVFLGGSLIVANHLAEFSDNVTILTAIGNNCSRRDFINSTLNSSIKKNFFLSNKDTTLTKKRYVLKDGNSISKLFETYSSNENILDDSESEKVTDFLNKRSDEYDLIVVCDFGNGFINPNLTEVISNQLTFLALNTQSNSGNRGFNVVTHYKKADYISLNEPEARLAAQDRKSDIKVIAENLKQKLGSNSISITRGVEGVLCLDKEGTSSTIPALNSSSIDRVGAGDSFLAISALSLAKTKDLTLSAFLGSIAAALDIQIVGNREPVKKTALLKFLIRLMK